MEPSHAAPQLSFRLWNEVPLFFGGSPDCGDPVVNCPLLASGKPATYGPVVLSAGGRYQAFTEITNLPDPPGSWTLDVERTDTFQFVDGRPSSTVLHFGGPVVIPRTGTEVIHDGWFGNVTADGPASRELFVRYTYR